MSEPISDMSDARRGDRPRSPHLSIYRPQLTSVLSIVHRLTGVGLLLVAVLIVWWFAALASGPAAFDFINGLLVSWLGYLVLLASLWAFWFHFFNGIRHLRWDAGVGLGIGEATRTGWTVVALSLVLTAITVVLAL